MKTVLTILFLLVAVTVDARDRERECQRSGQAGQYQFNFSCPDGRNYTIYAFPRNDWRQPPMPLRPGGPVAPITPRQMQRAGKP